MAEDSNVGSDANENPETNMENGGEDMPDFSDPEDYVDSISDEELLGDLLKNKPKETDGVESVIIVDGVPKVGPERVEKLKNVLHKLYSNFGKIVTVEYPLDENGVTKGYVFFEFASPENAIEAVKSTNGYKLDKHHIFDVNLFTDFAKYENIPDDWEPPSPQPYVDHGNLRYFLLEPDACDQYSVMYESGAKAAIYVNTNPEPTLLQERESWTETYVEWSPLGTYLATFHPRGVALWVGEKFDQFMKFSHNNVQCISFSPCEKYLVTFSNLAESRDDPNCVVIWEIRTGIKKRSFHADAHPVSTWPIFKWSHDDKYFAKIGKDVLSIYETPSFGLLGKKSIKIPGIKNFSWSPTQNIVAYWVAEEKDVPARVTLLEIPSRTELRAKNLFNVADCMMHWQKSGGYLCVKVDRYTKAKKEKNEWKYSGMNYNFEIFHMREKQIPVDSAEIKARWQSGVKNLKEGIQKIYQNKEFSDVTFVKKGKYEFKAHKMILIARSSYFQRLLLDPHLPEPVFIEEPAVTATGFEILLRFIYTDKIGTDVKTSIIDAWIAANFYDQKALLMECEKIIESWEITEEEVWVLLNAGLTVPKLKMKCIDFIKSNSSQVISSPSFLNISLDCLNVILESKVLNNVPIFQRIDRIMDWAVNHSEWADDDGNVSCHRIRTEFLKSTHSVLGKLHIETLDMQELGRFVKKYRGLIESDELMGFALYNNGDDSQLPDWCNLAV